MIRERGFTLAELAIAVLILGLLLAGALIPLSTQLEVRGIADTRRTMDQINDALIGFAQANGRLPCPANGALVSGVSTAGLEQYNTTTKQCTTQIGVIPWSTLGVTEVDAWGRRFTYRVAKAFSDDYVTNTTWFTTSYTASTYTTGNQSDTCSPATTPTLSSFAMCAHGEIAVLNRTTDAALSKPTPGVLGSGLAAVFVSHGKNGYGGYQTNGIQISGLTASTDEAANTVSGIVTGSPGGGLNTNTSYLFYSRTPTPSPSGSCSESVAGQIFCEFDDIVYMVPSSTLVGRMISAGRLP